MRCAPRRSEAEPLDQLRLTLTEHRRRCCARIRPVLTLRDPHPDLVVREQARVLDPGERAAVDRSVEPGPTLTGLDLVRLLEHRLQHPARLSALERAARRSVGARPERHHPTSRELHRDQNRHGPLRHPQRVEPAQVLTARSALAAPLGDRHLELRQRRRRGPTQVDVVGDEPGRTTVRAGPRNGMADNQLQVHSNPSS